MPVNKVIEVYKQGPQGIPGTSGPAFSVTYDNAASGLAADNVQSAIDEVEARLDVVEAPPASTVTYDNTTSGLVATNVQVAVDEVEARVESLEASPQGTIVFQDYTPQATPPAHKAGRIYYDLDKHALSVLNDDPSVEVHLGLENVMKVYNNSGGAVLRGQAVYITGAFGGNPTIALARADSLATQNAVGLVSSASIANNGTGYVTVSGLIHGINTSLFNEGDTLYLSPTVAGSLQNVKPNSPPDYIRTIGTVTNADALEGKLWVSTGKQTITLSDLYDVDYSTPPVEGDHLIYQNGQFVPVAHGITILNVQDATTQVIPDHDGTLATEHVLQLGTAADDAISVSGGTITYLKDLPPFSAHLEVNIESTGNNKVGQLAAWVELSAVGEGPWLPLAESYKVFDLPNNGGGLKSFNFSTTAPRQTGQRARVVCTNIGDAGSIITVKPATPLTTSKGAVTGVGVKLTFAY